MSQLLFSRTELPNCTQSVLIESCEHTICLDLTILFLYATAHKAWIFEKFIFEAFSNDIKINCILVWQLMSIKKIMVSSETFKFFFFFSWSLICNPLILMLTSRKIASTLQSHLHTTTLRVDTPNELLS